MIPEKIAERGNHQSYQVSISRQNTFLFCTEAGQPNGTVHPAGQAEQNSHGGPTGPADAVRTQWCSRGWEILAGIPSVLCWSPVCFLQTCSAATFMLLCIGASGGVAAGRRRHGSCTPTRSTATGTARSDKLIDWRVVQRWPGGRGVVAGGKVDGGWWKGVSQTDTGLGTSGTRETAQQQLLSYSCTCKSNCSKLCLTYPVRLVRFCGCRFPFFMNTHQRTKVDGRYISILLRCSSSS